MPTPRRKKPTPRRRQGPEPVSQLPKAHQMFAAEYFNFRRHQIATTAHQGREIAEREERAQFQIVKQDEAQRNELLNSIKPGYHWVTIHWLVPYGDGFRAHCISGTVKQVERGKLQMWVKSQPDASETALHGISQGDYVEVPLEAVTSVSVPMEG